MGAARLARRDRRRGGPGPAVAAGLVCAGLLAGAAQARDQIRIVGSSTVFPFATAVAEQFGRATAFKTPVVESTGTGGGFKLFCAGVGVDHPDIADASRAIKDSEKKDCARNGVTAITEVRIGYDGIVLANAKAGPAMSITVPQLWLALVRQVPAGGTLAANPYRRWRDIDPALPDEEIEVLGPPPTSGTRDAFVELVMDKGCAAFPEIQALDGDARRLACETLREDGAFVEAGENDNLIVQKLEANPQAFGIFGFSFLDQNADRLQGGAIGGARPSFESIASGAYPVSRPLFLYVKNAHVGVIPGIREYIEAFMSDQASGEDGYLLDKGLIPLMPEERAAERQRALALQPILLTP
ncbi:MAG: PstS family phosphate ABC transporter substrate-binding protein [Rhodospirillaceae bacterium]|nr:PstS family phosphate ABC transporter substrate-binding protein [Rhodospirillaceae bacterium]